MKLVIAGLILVGALLVSVNSADAAIALLEFNISSSRTGVFASLPHRYIPVRSEISWYFNGTTYINMSKIVELPEGEYAFFSNNPENLIVDIDQEKGIVSVRPKQGWVGEETVIIYADGIGSEAIKEKGSAGLIFNAIEADELKAVFFDDTLYSYFSSRLFSVAELDKGLDTKVDVVGQIDREQGLLTLDVGKDVEIITSFYKEDGREKPKVSIFIDASLASFSSRVGHCADGIRNYDEIDVDCGGECIECARQSLVDYTLVYALLVVAAGVVVLFVMVRLRKARPKKKIAKVRVSTRDIRHSIARQIELLRHNINDSNIERVLNASSRLVRSYFRNLFHIKYNFTYFELKNELDNKRVDKAMKERMLKLFSRMSKAEYSQYKIDRKGLEELIREAVSIIDKFEMKE